MFIKLYINVIENFLETAMQGLAGATGLEIHDEAYPVFADRVGKC